MEIGAFLNTKIEDTGFFAAVGDTGLAPWRALLGGKTYALRYPGSMPGLTTGCDAHQTARSRKSGIYESTTNPLAIREVMLELEDMGELGLDLLSSCYWTEVEEMNKVWAVVLVIIELVTGLFLIFLLFKGLSACFSDVREAHEALQAKSIQLESESRKQKFNRTSWENYQRGEIPGFLPPGFARML